ncbi:MAG: hypothetical protein WCD11_23805 [Solirubrobacteraceae bacterium]
MSAPAMAPNSSALNPSSAAPNADRVGGRRLSEAVDRLADSGQQRIACGTDLPGDAERAAIGLTAHDQSRANAMGGLDVDEIPATSSGAEVLFAACSHVRIVVDVHRPADACGELGRRVQVDPVGQDRRGADHAGVGIERTRNAGGDACQIRHGQPGRAQAPRQQVGGRIERVSGMLIYVRGLAFVGEYAAARIGDGHEHVAVAEVDRSLAARDAGMLTDRAEQLLSGAPSSGGRFSHVFRHVMSKRYRLFSPFADINHSCLLRLTDSV